MSCTSSCLSADELRRLLLGALPEGEAERSEQHLLECDACLQTLATLQAQDTLGAALAESSTLDPPIDSHIDVEGLIRRLKELCPPARDPTAVAACPAPAVPDQIG